MKISEINNKYGMLTVTSAAPTKHGKAYWVALCDCGKGAVVAGSSLRNGTATHCGCQRAASTAPSYTLQDARREIGELRTTLTNLAGRAAPAVLATALIGATAPPKPPEPPEPPPAQPKPEPKPLPTVEDCDSALDQLQEVLATPFAQRPAGAAMAALKDDLRVLLKTVDTYLFEFTGGSMEAETLPHVLVRRRRFGAAQLAFNKFHMNPDA